MIGRLPGIWKGKKQGREKEKAVKKYLVNIVKAYHVHA